MNLGAALLELSTTAPGLADDRAHARHPGAGVPAPRVRGRARRPAPGRISSAARPLATVRAAYFAGGVLPDAPVTWNVRSTPGQFTPPGRDDFTFGDVGAVVAAVGRARRVAHGDLRVPHRRRRPASPEDRVRARRPAAGLAGRGRGHGDGREPPGLDVHRAPARPSRGRVRGAPLAAAVRAAGRAPLRGVDRGRPRRARGARPAGDGRRWSAWRGSRWRGSGRRCRLGPRGMPADLRRGADALRVPPHAKAAATA